MNWEAAGAIGEMIGAVAVIGSLLFVGNQLRQAQNIAKADAQRELLIGAAEWMSATRHDPDLFEVVSRLIYDYASASPGDRHRFSSWGYELLMLVERGLYMHRDGYMNPGAWRGFEGMAMSVLLTPGGAEWWQEARRVWGADAVAHFDAALAAADEATPRFDALRPEFAAKHAEIRRQQG